MNQYDDKSYITLFIKYEIYKITGIDRRKLFNKLLSPLFLAIQVKINAIWVNINNNHI